MNGVGTVFVFLNREGGEKRGGKRRGLARVGGKNRHANSEVSTVAGEGFYFSLYFYVPVKSHILVFGPILSPSLPMRAPPRKLSREHNACWSDLWNVRSSGVSRSRASARASYIWKRTFREENKKRDRCGFVRTCAEFPVWKAHQINTAENATMSLDFVGVHVHESFLYLRKKKSMTDMKPVKKHHIVKGHTAFVVSMSPQR